MGAQSVLLGDHLQTKFRLNRVERSDYSGRRQWQWVVEDNRAQGAGEGGNGGGDGARGGGAGEG